MLALHGLPALRFLKTQDPEERLILLALARRVMQVDNQRQQNLARHVVNELGRAMKRG